MSNFVMLSTLLALVAGLFVVPTLWLRGPQTRVAQTPPKRWAALGLLAALLLATAGVYRAVGEPRALAPQPAQADITPAQIDAMVSRLAQRLQSQPNDPDGWRRLARSYETLGRFQLAVQAYQRLLALQAPDADLLTDYAVTLGMSLDQTLVGEPEKVLDEALRLNPRHLQALALSGSAAFEKKDYQRAMQQWRTLLALVPPEAEMRASIERDLLRAQDLAGLHTP